MAWVWTLLPTVLVDLTVAIGVGVWLAIRLRIGKSAAEAWRPPEP